MKTLTRNPRLGDNLSGRYIYSSYITAADWNFIRNTEGNTTLAGANDGGSFYVQVIIDGNNHRENLYMTGYSSTGSRVNTRIATNYNGTVSTFSVGTIPRFGEITYVNSDENAKKLLNAIKAVIPTYVNYNGTEINTIYCNGTQINYLYINGERYF